jgi:hypothetical protein
LSQCPGVLSVVVNEVSGSVLIAHEAAEPDILVAYARTFDVFEVAEPTPAATSTRPPGEILTHRLRDMDAWVRAQTSEATDLRSVALAGLAGAAIWQLLRGQAFPAAATLIWYAVAVAGRGRTDGSREQEASERAHDDGVDSLVG